MRESPTVRFPVLKGNDHFRQIPAGRFIVSPTENDFRASVPIEDMSVFIHADDGIERRIDDAADTFFAFPQSQLGL